MSPSDNNVTPLGPYRQAKLLAKAVAEMAKTPANIRYSLMAIKACQDPKTLRECMVEVCKRDKKAPDYLKWPHELTGDMRLWFDIFGNKGPNTGFERAFYFWMHRGEFCTSVRHTPYGAEDPADEWDPEDVLKRSAILALTGKLVWDAISTAAPLADAALARIFLIALPRGVFERPKDLVL